MSTLRALHVRMLGAVAALAMLGVVCVVNPSSAVAEGGVSMHLSKAVYVLADGAALEVPFSYACPGRFGSPRGYAIVSFTVTQQAHGESISGADPGGDPANLHCDGAVHQAHVDVQPTAGDGPTYAYWTSRVAHVHVDILACDAAEEHCLDSSADRLTDAQQAPPNDPVDSFADATATIRPSGAIQLAVPHGCRAGGFAHLDVYLFGETVQRHRLSVPEVWRYPATCTPHQTSVVGMHPLPSALPGTGFVLATWDVCDQAQCASGTVEGLIHIRRG